ncbi:ABC transporter permease [Rhodococcoides fascians]|uniref:ABC transporter permease n=1 Tax=Rhodococcoides fascians TaxID=1828 RepID=UPI00050CF1D8|nr:ABC transporter permease [Rhodococcus fascians]
MTSTPPITTPPDLGPVGDAENEYSAGTADGVRLICRRELSERLPSKAFLGSTAFLAILAFAGLFFSGGSDADTPKIGYTGDLGPVAAALDNAGGNGVSVRGLTDRAEGERLLADSELTAVVTGNSSTGFTTIVQESLSVETEGFIDRALESSALEQLALESGAQPGDVSNALSANVSQLEILDPAGNSTDLLVAMVVSLTLVLIIVLWGNTLASGVVDEKASRVVEVLLATIRPWQLLTGKVLAIAVLGLIQASALAAAVFAALAFDRNGSSLPSGMVGPTLFVGLVSLVLGVLLYLSLMAAFAARVERQEDLGAALQPVFVVCIGPFVASLLIALDSPQSPWLDIASIAPFFGPFAMPLRMAAEPVPVWQLLTSLLVCLVTIAAVGALSGRIYGNSILRSGGRVPLKEALTNR